MSTPSDGDLSFPNAPLIELSVELGWSETPSDEAPAFGDTEMLRGRIPAYVGNQRDLTNRLRKELGDIGFPRSTREFPEGFPVGAGMPLISWEGDDDQSPVDIRSGMGYFSVSGRPPYKSWKTFAPKVSQALIALLNSRDDANKAAPFERLALRYIDAFDDKLIQGWTPRQFTEQVLGFKTLVPDVISKTFDPAGAPLVAFTTLHADVTDDFHLSVAVGEATVNGERAVVLDLTLVSNSPVDADVKAVMARLDLAHTYVRTTFLALITDILSRLEGESDDPVRTRRTAEL